MSRNGAGPAWIRAVEDRLCLAEVGGDVPTPRAGAAGELGINHIHPRPAQAAFSVMDQERWKEAQAGRSSRVARRSMLRSRRPVRSSRASAVRPQAGGASGFTMDAVMRRVADAR